MKKRKISVGLWLMCGIFVAGCILGKVEVRTQTYSISDTGKKVDENEKCHIDYSNSKDGYVTVRYKEVTEKKIKVQTIANDNLKRTYTYTIKPKKKEVIPLTEGDGTYKITVYLNLTGNEYITVLSETIRVELKSEFAPYLRPNQYVNYKKSTKVVKKAAALTKKKKTDLAKLRKIYKYVISNYQYDKKLARRVGIFTQSQ